MRCKEYEYLIIESTERDLTDSEHLRLKQHCSQCENCSHFKEYIEEIFCTLKRSDPPALPADLDIQTKDLCQDEISGKKEYCRHEQRPLRPQVPVYIWAVFALLTILTSFMLFSGLKTVNSDQSLSLETVLMLTIILQNAVMLFLAPVIILTKRAKQGISNLNKLECS